MASFWRATRPTIEGLIRQMMRPFAALLLNRTPAHQPPGFTNRCHNALVAATWFML